MYGRWLTRGPIWSQKTKDKEIPFMSGFAAATRVRTESSLDLFSPRNAWSHCRSPLSLRAFLLRSWGAGLLPAHKDGTLQRQRVNELEGIWLRDVTWPLPTGLEEPSASNSTVVPTLRIETGATDQAWPPAWEGGGNPYQGAAWPRENSVASGTGYYPIAPNPPCSIRPGLTILYKITVFIVSVFKCYLKIIRNALALYIWIQ